jgi:FeS assembly SUF system regulator
MIRLGKLTDYGVVLLSYMARAHAPATATADAGGFGQAELLHTARELAAESRLPLPTVSKILKQLLQSGVLVSSRGVKGGYALAREPREISIAEVIVALEGPIALTECSTNLSGACDLEQCCPIKNNQRVINRAVRGALEQLTLADLLHPLRLTTIQDARGKLIPAIASGRIQ